ncbi:PTS sugar transporter subunit IIB [Clostridium simiarum]|uniref:PTS sugar transporter subunit IIB n=1 Tax=Clostridium simiarum TaxID=2841506 RepID=UPI001FE495C9|nr:PTS sugar transporter subunit IIB [Clostridium simiarum]
MINIALFCSAGMSTSLLVTKIEKAALERGIEISINAYPEADMAQKIQNVDVALIGPQVRYALTKMKKLCDEKGVPIDVISPQDYGLMNGEKVLDQALKLAKK